jgi:hypothetical protein
MPSPAESRGLRLTGIFAIILRSPVPINHILQ